jgi:peptide/nickel transport system substrate-binding protein
MAMVLAVPGVTNDSEAAAAEYDIMYVGVTQTPDTLNVYKMTLAIGWTINFLLYDTLNSIDEQLAPGPQLADSWETDETGLVWTFHINQTAYWHDGQQVTAEDVAFSYNLILENPTACALWIDYLTGVVYPVEAVDTYTVRITTEQPKATMLSALIPIVPEHLWSQVDTNMINKIDPWDTTVFPDGPVGSGPLILDEYDATLGWIRMLKNPDYYIDTVKVDEVMFIIYDTPEAMTTALQVGDIDVAMDVPAKVWDEVLAYDGIDGQAGKALSIFELGINCASEELRESFPKASENLETTNLSVRRAIAMATEKDYIVDDIMEGLADVGTSIIPTATAYWHWPVPEEKRWDYDLERANATLDAAGYLDSDGNGIRENGTSGVELSFSFYYRTTSPDDREAAMRISAALSQIGIYTEPDGVSEGVMYNLWLGCEMDLFIWAWDTDVDPNFMLSTQTTSQIPLDPQDWTKWSDSFWSNATYDAMYLEQQFTVDLEERQAIVHAMQEMLYDQCPYVVLYYPLGLYAYTTEKFTNYPDWVTNPGMTPGTMWFFFEVTPSAEWVDPMPPEDVYAGADQTCVVGETLWFTGSATDPNDLEETLNWTWTFMEPDETEDTRWGQTVSYQFDQVGDVGVMLVVTDPGGEMGVDDLTVTVSEISVDMGTLTGRVVDQDSEPVLGATVTAGNATRSTDADGVYSVTMLAGTYTVNATKTGYQMDSVEATVAAGETTWANLTLTLTSGTLVVSVLDSETGEAIGSAVVNVTYGTASKEYLTQANGNATFNSVDAGSIQIRVSKSGYEENSTTATVVAGETTAVVVELTPEPEDDGSNTLLIAAAAIGALAILAIAAVLLMRKRKAGSGGEEPPLPDSPAP